MNAPNASPFPRMTSAASDLGLGQKLQSESDLEAERMRKRKKMLDSMGGGAAASLFGSMDTGTMRA